MASGGGSKRAELFQAIDHGLQTREIYFITSYFTFSYILCLVDTSPLVDVNVILFFILTLNLTFPSSGFLPPIPSQIRIVGRTLVFPSHLHFTQTIINCYVYRFTNLEVFQSV